MSLDDSQEEDCTVFIEELKSDNPSLKLNAAGKLPVIASVLGHNRIRDQLVPYLIEIIEQMDNENQFLIKVSQGLYELKPFCKNSDQSYILLPPLKILASLDQPSVRQKAVESIQKLINNLDQDFHETHIYPLILQMSDKKNPYSPRVSASCLLSSCYPFVREQFKLQLQKTFKKLGVQENSPLVRRSVAENISNYAAVVPKAVTKTDVLEIWQKFIQDKIDIVKIKALENASTIARFFKKDEINEKMFKYIKEVDVDKKAWRIRYALAQSLASLLPNLEKDLIKKDSVEIFEELLKDTEAQVRTIAVLKVSELAQKLSQQQSFNIFFEYIEKASKDTSTNVRLALIQILPDYLATIDNEKIKDNGIALIMNLIKDENQNIRTGLIQKIKDLHRVIGQDNTNQYLLPLIENSLTDKKWRFKLAVAETIKDLFSNIDYESHKDFFNKVCKTFLKDHYYAVREQTMTSLINLKGVLGPQKSMQVVGQFIKTMIGEANYVYRVSGVQFLMKAHGALDKNDFNEVFVAVCKALESEKVPNVLIAFLSNYPKIKGNLNGQGKKQFQTVFRKLREFDDEDVQYYANIIEE